MLADLEESGESLRPAEVRSAVKARLGIEVSHDTVSSFCPSPQRAKSSACSAQVPSTIESRLRDERPKDRTG